MATLVEAPLFATASTLLPDNLTVKVLLPDVITIKFCVPAVVVVLNQHSAVIPFTNDNLFEDGTESIPDPFNNMEAPMKLADAGVTVTLASLSANPP